MKKLNQQTEKWMLVLVVFGLTFTNCSNEETDKMTSEEQDTTELTKSSEIDEAEVFWAI